LSAGALPAATPSMVHASTVPASAVALTMLLLAATV
jgi:hypothetical protein